MTDKATLLALAATESYAGAARYLRSIDPLYQAEIGIEREWDVDVEVNAHGCDCCYCVERTSVFVTAVTAAEAVRLAYAELPEGGVITGIRVKGATTGYADIDAIPSETEQ